MSSADANGMTVEQYIAKAKKELDTFAATWHRQCELAPNCYPQTLSEGEWGEQELASRFGQC